MPVYKFCRHCGADLAPGDAFCRKCGTPAGRGANYCWNCKNPTDAGAAFCVRCGAQLKTVSGQAPYTYTDTESKSKIAAGLFGIFLGGLGIHNFYLGYTGKAVAQLVLLVLGFATLGITSIIAGIWGFVEGILILTGSIGVDAAGKPLRD
jgi:TM2 domain-containing membrane protein YozV/ribosomal protein L40E